MIDTFKFHRANGLNSIDACTDAAQLHGITFQAAAALFIAAGLGDRRLSLCV